MSSENYEAFIKMALDAGFESVTVVQNSFADPTKQEIFANGNEVNLTKFAQLVAEHEREEAAKLCDRFSKESHFTGHAFAGGHLAQKIRART